MFNIQEPITNEQRKSLITEATRRIDDMLAVPNKTPEIINAIKGYDNFVKTNVELLDEGEDKDIIRASGVTNREIKRADRHTLEEIHSDIRELSGETTDVEALENTIAKLAAENGHLSAENSQLRDALAKAHEHITQLAYGNPSTPPPPPTDLLPKSENEGELKGNETPNDGRVHT